MSIDLKIAQRDWYKQFKTLVYVFLFAYVPALFALVGVGLWASATNRRVWFFTGDPFVTGHLPFYAGIISTIGIILWCSTASICFFSAAVDKKDDHTRKWKSFLFMSGFFTSMLLCDDLFQMHKILYPKLFYLSTILVYGAYGLFALWYLIHFRKQILETEFLLLVFSIAFFVFAVIADTFPLLSRGNTAFSDAFKFFGIVSWFVYFVRTCSKKVQGLR